MENSATLPRYCRWALGLALLLTAPSLLVGLQLDDYFHWGLVTQQNPVLHTNSPASPYGLFSFLDGDPGRVLDLTNLGLLPWWSNPEVKYAFWRPLAEFTLDISDVKGLARAVTYVRPTDSISDALTQRKESNAKIKNQPLGCQAFSIYRARQD